MVLMGSGLEKTTMRWLFILWFVSMVSSETTRVVKSCAELRTALNPKESVDRIVVYGHFVCNDDDKTEPVNVTESVIIEGSAHSNPVASIDWMDSGTQIIATENVTITFKNLIFLQDSPGVIGVNLNFLNADEGSQAIFEGIVVGLRECGHHIGQYDQVFRNLIRPRIFDGEQRAVRFGFNGLGVLDVAYSVSVSGPTWRMCNGAFLCDVCSPDDSELVGIFNKLSKTPICSELSSSPESVRALFMNSMSEAESGGQKDSLDDKWIMALAGILTGVMLLSVAFFVCRFFLPYCRSRINQGTGGISHIDGKTGMIELPMGDRKHTVELNAIELGELLGEGPFGAVYSGNNKGLPVAVKAVDHGEIENMSKGNEALKAYINSQAYHSNVVCMYLYQTHKMDDLYRSLIGSWTSRSQPGEVDSAYLDIENAAVPFKANFNSHRTFIVMEYCSLGTLSRAIESGEFHTVSPSYRIKTLGILQTALEIAQGMCHLHSQDIMHGDLKARNILLERDRTHWRGVVCKVGDYGMSHFVKNRAILEATPLEMIIHIAPEVLNDGHLTQAGDIYSFGMLMWQLVTGEMPLRHMRQDVEISDIIKGERPTLFDEIPENCSWLIHECWQKDHLMRPPFSVIVEHLRKMMSDIEDQESTESGGDIKSGPDENVLGLVRPSLESYEASSNIYGHEVEDLAALMEQFHQTSKTMESENPLLETDCNLLPPVPRFELCSTGSPDEDGYNGSSRDPFSSPQDIEEPGPEFEQQANLPYQY